jgi:phosphocarrier protein FPr
MIGLVVVSHSEPLAQAAATLAAAMPGVGEVPIKLAAGTEDGRLGTDAMAVAEAIRQLDSPDGVVVLADLGSAVLSAELALELVEAELPGISGRVTLSAAPLVEGLVAAAVTAAGGGNRTEVAREAEAALTAKRAALADDDGPSAAPPDPPERTSAPAPPGAVSAIFAVVGEHGLHARPAALLVAEARAWNAEVRLRNVTTGSQWVSGASLAAVTTLGAVKGHQIELSVTGPEARQALYALVAGAETGFGDGAGSVAAVAGAEPADPGAGGPRPASPGYAVGPVRHLVAAPVRIPDTEPGSPAEQRTRLDQAIEAVCAEIAGVRAAALPAQGPGGPGGDGPAAEAAIFDAHILLLRDPGILGRVDALLAAGRGAASAWDQVLGELRAQFEALDDPYLRTRAADVRGLADRVTRRLLGLGGAQVSGPGILVAQDLDPSAVAGLDAGVVTAIVLAAGSPASHAAILARSLGIPMVTGAGAEALTWAEGTKLAVDATAGRLTVAPDAATVAELKAKRKARAKARRAAAKAARDPARMAEDGPVIPVQANVGSIEEAVRGAAQGADGCGLVRTEFLFQGLREPPSPADQAEIYRAIAAAFGGARVVFRTLDAGGDKPIGYLPLPPEDNPFLGVRGLRLGLRYPNVLSDQLMALIEVARDYPVSIMFPMVATVAELREARILTARAAFRQGGSVPDRLKVGIMVEVPATAMNAASFAPTVDFFSVGTNDLTGYAMAADRANPAVAGLSDSLDPGVLALIRALSRSARGRASVSVCGEIASDPTAAPILVGLGVRSLSVAPPQVAEVKAAVRSWTKAQARVLARRALACPDAAAVRDLLAAPRPAAT